MCVKLYNYNKILKMNPDQKQKQIFEPLKLTNLTLKNRILRSATAEAIATPDGSIDEKAYSR